MKTPNARFQSLKSTAFLLSLFAEVTPLPAHAIHSCSGSLGKENFGDERKQAQADLQKSILDYRKLESGGDKSAEVKSQLAEIKTRIDSQKKKFNELDSKYFPRTPVIAYGSACNDRRWLEPAKAKLVENPTKMGKQWYVWLDKDSGEPKAAQKRPAFEVMAE